MMYNASPHIWIVAPYTKDQEEVWNARAGSATSRYRIDCHRNLGGPYTGTGELLRRIVPEIYKHCPDLVKAHSIEILSIAPELQAIVPPPLRTLTSLAIPQERTRFYAYTRTRRLAHGIVELLSAYVCQAKLGCLSLFFMRVEDADPLDQQFIAALLRRTRALPFFIAVGTTSKQPPEIIHLAVKKYTHQVSASPLSMQERETLLESRSIPHAWGEWLLQHTEGWRDEWETLLQFPALLTMSIPSEEQSFEQGVQTTLLHAPQAARESLAQAFVESDCIAENPWERIAYQLVDGSVRQQLHNERADTLEKFDQHWHALGAIPYHRERGNDPSVLGAKALGTALNYCFDMGYYEATRDYGARGREIVDRETQLKQYWNFTTKMITALVALERLEEAEQYCKEMRAFTSTASIQMQLAYMTAMLYTRLYKDQRRDHMLAKEWIQMAIALACTMQGVSAEERAFMTVFNQNALALVETNLGRNDEALRLIAEGLERMDKELGPGAYQLHRTVLLHNRGQVYVKLRQYEQALVAFSDVIERDPYYSEYYFDRGNVYRHLGRYEEALEDYGKAILFSPPYPEAYYNRAAIFSLMRREEEALADYTYALELEPSSDSALINRVGILYEQGRYTEARQDIAEGLVMHPGHPQLLCTLGLIEMAEQQPEQAYLVLSAAVEGDPSLSEAWSNRAVLEFERGNVDAAIDDLSRALTLRADATVLYNRGFAYQSQGRWQEAITDYSRALSLTDADEQELLYQRAVCYLREQQVDLAREDFAAHLERGTSPHVDEILRLIPSLSMRV